jgi:hypothetical protein
MNFYDRRELGALCKRRGNCVGEHDTPCRVGCSTWNYLNLMLLKFRVELFIQKVSRKTSKVLAGDLAGKRE